MGRLTDIDGTLWSGLALGVPGGQRGLCPVNVQARARRALCSSWSLLPVALALLSGCGDGGNTRTAPHRGSGVTHAVPVAEQLRDALQRAMHAPAPIASIRRPPRAFQSSDVRRCAGPANGGAGTYRCALTSTRPSVPRSLTVRVDRHGTWSTTLPVGRPARKRVVRALWGTGLRVPSP